MLGEIDFVEIISSKCSTTFRALSQPRIVTTANTLGAEDMEALGEDGVLLSSGTTWTVQFGLRLCVCVMCEEK